MTRRRRPRIDPHDRQAAISGMEALAQSLGLEKRGAAWGPCPWCGSHSLTFFARRLPRRDEVYGMFICGTKAVHPSGRGVLYCDARGGAQTLIDAVRQTLHDEPAEKESSSAPREPSAGPSQIT